jgi:hypothetical protein
VTTTAYEVTCRCGQVLRGARGRRHQVVPCPGCGRGVFVLPGAPVAAPRRARRSLWGALRWPLLAGALCLIAVVVGYSFALPYLKEQRFSLRSARPDPETLKAHLDAGRQALHQGRFRVALRELNAAVALRDRHPGALSAEENRALNQRQRQAQLLARLLHLTLEEVVARGKLVRNAEEWAEQFEDFRGRSVIFDDAVRRDDDGHPVLANHAVEAGDEPVRLALEDLEVLRDLPLGNEPRLIFGARLRSCLREQGGVWVVRFEPDSGVLFTDAEAVEAAFPVAAGEGLGEVMKRQRKWLDDRPMAPPARP